MKIARHRGMKKAIVALARRLAVIMHRIWVDGTDFRWTREVAVGGVSGGDNLATDQSQARKSELGSRVMGLGSMLCAPIPHSLRTDSLIRTNDAINGMTLE
jgi:hypothetical protein